MDAEQSMYLKFNQCNHLEDFAGLLKEYIPEGAAGALAAGVLLGNVICEMEAHGTDKVQFVEALLPYCPHEVNSLGANSWKAGGLTPLHYVVRSDMLDTGVKKKLIKALCRGGADPNVCKADSYGYRIPALAMTDEPEVIDVLAECGADFTRLCLHANGLPLGLIAYFLSEKFVSPQDASRAVFDKRLECLKRLISHGAPVNPVPIKNNLSSEGIGLTKSPLMCLCCAGKNAYTQSNKNPSVNFMFLTEEYILKAAELLHKAGMDIDAVDERGRGALFYCDTYPLFSFMLDNVKDPMRVDYQGRCFLHRLAESYWRNADKLELAIDKGFDVNARDNDGRSPMFCVRDGKMLKLLVDGGGDVNLRDYYGNPPFLADSLVTNDLYNTILKDYAGVGADFSMKGALGKTVLHEWVERTMMCRPVAVTLKLQPDSELEEALNVLRLLTRNGADLNAVNDDGDTPMHLFLGRRGGLLPKRFVLPIVMAMLDEGADPLIKNNAGDTAFSLTDSNAQRNQLERYKKHLETTRASLDEDLNMFSR